MTKGILDLNVVIPIAVLCYGGTEGQTLQLVRTLIGLGCKVDVVCFYDHHEDIVKEFEEGGATVTLLNHTRRRGKISLFKRLFSAYRERRPDVVHVQYVEQGFVALAAAWAARIPIRIATVHQLGSPYGKFQQVLLRAAARLSTVFVCVSQAAERSWFDDSALWDQARAGSRKHWTIYNCVDVGLITRIISQDNHEALRTCYCTGDGPVVGIVGRTSNEKGQSVLLDAFSLVVKTFPAAKLLVIGEDYQRGELTAKAEMLGLKKSVILTGRLPAEEVFRLYGIMDVVAVPSSHEGFGLTAAEAMAAARPVVASRVGGLVEIVEDGATGILVEPQNYQELAAGIIKCLKAPGYAAKLGAEGHRRVAAMFSLETYSKEIRSLYEWATECVTIP